MTKKKTRPHFLLFAVLLSTGCSVLSPCPSIEDALQNSTQPNTITTLGTVGPQCGDFGGVIGIANVGGRFEGEGDSLELARAFLDVGEDFSVLPIGLPLEESPLDPASYLICHSSVRLRCVSANLIEGERMAVEIHTGEVDFLQSLTTSERRAGTNLRFSDDLPDCVAFRDRVRECSGTEVTASNRRFDDCAYWTLSSIAREVDIADSFYECANLSFRCVDGTAEWDTSCEE